MAESHLKILLRRILRSPLGSCKSKDQISDIVDTHHRRHHYQLLDLFSPPNPHPFMLQQPHYTTTKLPFLSPDLNGRRCPPASPIHHLHKNKKKPRNRKKSRYRKYHSGFEEQYLFPDCQYNGLFSSDEASRRRMAAVDDSLAVVKRSSDPYSDFRTSMVEMIVEKQIFAEKDLENLLHCFLALNSYHHHRIIIQVFAEIWEALLL